MQYMSVVFFIYGLAFFLLGFAVLVYPKKESSFDLAKNIGKTESDEPNFGFIQ